MAQHQGNNSQGSLWAGIRSMSMILFLNPFSMPIIWMLPLIGRLEIVSIMVLPDFWAVDEPGASRMPWPQRSLVGTVYGLGVFLILRAVLEFFIGLPLVGRPVEGGFDIVGGLDGQVVCSQASPRRLLCCCCWQVRWWEH